MLRTNTYCQAYLDNLSEIKIFSSDFIFKSFFITLQVSRKKIYALDFYSILAYVRPLLKGMK